MISISLYLLLSHLLIACISIVIGYRFGYVYKYVSILVNILFILTRSREIADIIIVTVQNYCLTFTFICNSLITYRLFLVISTNYYLFGSLEDFRFDCVTLVNYVIFLSFHVLFVHWKTSFTL